MAEPKEYRHLRQIDDIKTLFDVGRKLGRHSFTLHLRYGIYLQFICVAATI
jgi:hypothetical protein